MHRPRIQRESDYMHSLLVTGVFSDGSIFTHAVVVAAVLPPLSLAVLYALVHAIT